MPSAARRRPTPIAGPFHGLDWRDSLQTDKHCDIAINVDFHAGDAAPRYGFEVLSTGQALGGYLHVTHDPNGREFILLIGAIATTHDIHFTLFDLNGDILHSTTQDLTDEFGEIPTRNFRCTMVNGTIPTATNDARFVTWIATTCGLYIFDPNDPELFLRRVDMDTVSNGGDTIRLNSVNFAYANSTPRGWITTEHQGRLYQAGWGRTAKTRLSNPLEDDQILVKEAYISDSDGERFTLARGPHVVTYSDEFDWAAVQAHHFFAVEELEEVTGLVSFAENLVVFTVSAIYFMTGGTDETFALHKVNATVGCVSPHSIIQAAGQLFFMGRNGVYSLSQAGEVAKLSSPIDAIWTGRFGKTQLPWAMQTLAEDIAWPPHINHNTMHRTAAVHYQEANQIWWSIDTNSRTLNARCWTLVFDYVLQAWSLYTMRPADRTNGDAASCMVNAVSIRHQAHGPERIFSTNSIGELQRYGSYIRDGNDTDAKGIPVAYVTGRLFKHNDHVLRAKDIRLHILSKGDSSLLTDPPQYIVESENAAHNTSTLSKQGDVKLHPSPSNGNFWNDMTWHDGATGGSWEHVDTFASRVEASGQGRWLRVGFLDDADDEARAPLVHLSCISVETDSGSTR